MKRSIIIFYFLLLNSYFAFSQSSWHVLPSSPTQSFRHDDLYFINADTGWVVNVSGQVWNTMDGGNTWKQLISQSTSFRCVGFFDSIHGCIGNLGPGSWAPTSDTNPLYVTNNGGKTVTLPVIIGPHPMGICGMSVINDSVIAACGRFDGPAYFAYSTNRGNTWNVKDTRSIAGMLIDTKFISPDTGFVVGGTDSIESLSKSLILYTTDAGNTWTTKIIGKAPGNHCWKISHPSKMVFYVSVEELYSNDTLRFFKSVDGGATWRENIIKGVPYGWSQGIGFVNDSVGWIGGNTYVLATKDSGKIFDTVPSPLLINLNRMRFVNDTLGYAVGQRVYKYCNCLTDVPQITTDYSGYALEQNIPNPFTRVTTIKYTIPEQENVLIEVFDGGGRRITTLVNSRKAPGSYSIDFTLPYIGSGSFICTMVAGPYTKRIKMLAVN
jgi:photosystem II stability/assembly factor-like uncharacterized protein